MNIIIANRLKNLRKERGLSQEELAEKLGLSRQAVSKWERAESAPDTDNLIALANLYEISVDSLLFDSEKTDHRDTFSKAKDDQSRNEDEKKRKGGMFLFPYPVVTVILFFVLTFTNTGGGLAWLIYFTIPIYYGIAEIIYRKKKSQFKTCKTIKEDGFSFGQ